MQSGPGKKNARFCAQIESARGLPERRLQIVLSGIHPENSPTPIEGKAIWTWDSPPDNSMPLASQNVCLTRPVLPLHGFYNEPVSFYELSRRAQGIFWRVWSRESKGEPRFSGKADTLQAWRASLRDKLVFLLENSGRQEPGHGLSEAQALLPALLFGDRFYLRQATTENFSLAAIAHSLALSGQHLAIAGLLGLFCIAAAARFYPAIYLWRPRVILVAAASCPAALLYLWIGNAPPSLLRAACMMFVLFFLVVRSKAFSGQDVIFLALIIFLVLDPLVFLDIGAQLSFLCVFTIAAFLPGMKKIWPFYTHRTHRANFYKPFFQILLISLFIQLALLPLTLKYFGVAGLWFPVNALWLPVLSLVVLPCAAVGLFFANLPFAASEWMAGQFLDLAVFPCQILCESLEYLRQAQILAKPVFLRPHWSTLAAFALLIIGMACLAGKSDRKYLKKFFALGLLFLGIGPCLRLWDVLDGKPLVDILDVGQGQAICLNLHAGKRLLLDGGGGNSIRFDPGKALLAPALTDNAAPRISAVFNSHPDMDHLGGLIYLLDHLDSGAIFHNGREANGRLKDEWAANMARPNANALVRGDKIELGGKLYLEVLHPPANDATWKGNNASVVLRLCRDGVGLALFPGDAEVESLRNVLASGMDISARVLLAPHHGSNSSYLPDFLRDVNPEVIVAACGFRNRYAYPGKKLRTWAAKNGVPLYNTGDHGRIRIGILPNGELRIQPSLER